MSIGDVARNEKEKDARQELRQAYESKVERPLGDFINLPAHRDRLHLVGEDNAEARSLEKYKTRILERDAAGGGGVFGFGHRPLLCHKSRLRVRWGRADSDVATNF